MSATRWRATEFDWWRHELQASLSQAKVTDRPKTDGGNSPKDSIERELLMSDSSKSGRIVLREERSETDIRHLSVGYATNGDLAIEGQDLGDVVRRVFGCDEYEWVWTIRSADVPKLAMALGVASDRLEALAASYSGDNAANLGAFLKVSAVPFETWSRIGD